MAKSESIQNTSKDNQLINNQIDPDSTSANIANLPGTDFNKIEILNTRGDMDENDMEKNLPNDQDNNYQLTKQNSLFSKSTVRGHIKINYDLLAQVESSIITDVPEIKQICPDYDFSVENIAAAKESLV